LVKNTGKAVLNRDAAIRDPARFSSSKGFAAYNIFDQFAFIGQFNTIKLIDNRDQHQTLRDIQPVLDLFFDFSPARLRGFIYSIQGFHF
jgi:hypothetical protein